MSCLLRGSVDSLVGMFWLVSAALAEEKARAGSTSPELVTTCPGPVNARGGFVYSLGSEAMSLFPPV